MDNKKLRKDFLTYMILNIAGMAGLSCYILADTFFIARGLGADGLTALNLAVPVYSFVHGSGLMLGMGGATRFAIFKSQKKQESANRIFTAIVCAAIAMAVMFVLLGLFKSEEIAVMLGADAAVYAMTRTYLKVLLLFAPAFMLNNVLLCFVRNDGNPRLSMFAMLGGSIMNIVLDYIFIFPLQMGIFGAVFATGLAPVISLLLLSGHWLKKEQGFHLVKGNIELRMTAGAMLLGFPSLIGEVASGIVIIVFNAIILRLAGNTGVAAYGVIANISLVVIAVYTGISQGSQPLLSRYYGEGKQAEVTKLLHYSLLTMIIISALIYTVIYFFADSITAIFNSGHNLQLQEIASYGLRIYFMAVLFAGFNIILSVFFTSTERAAPAHLISLLRGLFIIVPMAYILSSLFGLTGVWLSFGATEFLVAVFGGAMYFAGRKRSKP